MSILGNVLGVVGVALMIYAYFRRTAWIHDKPLVRGKMQTLFGNDLKG